LHAAAGAATRARVPAAPARLTNGEAGQPGESRRNGTASSSADVVDGEVIETGGGEETSSAVPACESETPPSVDPRAELDQVRSEVQQLAGRLAMDFDTVNERCFDDFGVSYQDASTEQLRTLLQTLQPGDGGPGDDSSTEVSSTEADTTASTPPTRRHASAKKATPRKAAAKKTATRKATAEKPAAVSKSSRSKPTTSSAP
jgi:hypothetical protein